ncbi:MAG: hypothetical protein IPL61_19030 [Myxococcales bacterium]|nr:hypothetical protein [Myxococcales bacterium]
MTTPNRSTTHREIDMTRLAGLGLELEELAEGGPITPDRVIALAEEQGKPPSHYYAAVALATELELPTAPVTAVVCAGKCQSWGALECLDAAVTAWEQRPGFAIAVRSCLDKCAEAPVVELRTPDGTAVLLRAKAADVTAALATATE